MPLKDKNGIVAFTISGLVLLALLGGCQVNAPAAEPQPADAIPETDLETPPPLPDDGDDETFESLPLPPDYDDTAGSGSNSEAVPVLPLLG